MFLYPCDVIWLLYIGVLSSRITAVFHM